MNKYFRILVSKNPSQNPFKPFFLNNTGDNNTGDNNNLHTAMLKTKESDSKQINGTRNLWRK